MVAEAPSSLGVWLAGGRPLSHFFQREGYSCGSTKLIGLKKNLQNLGSGVSSLRYWPHDPGHANVTS